MDNYYSRVNNDLLRSIPADARIVVEIVCGAGVLGEQYKRINPFCHYIGIELNPEAASAAEQRLDQVLCGDVENMDLDKYGIHNVDCFVYGDGLEHMRNPWSVLSDHATRLSPEGQVVACIPNVQHWSILAGLLRGEWEYQPEGLLDHTHLRFFTLSSIRKLFKEAGLFIFCVQPRGNLSPGYNQFRQLFLPVAEQLGVNTEEFAHQSAALQYIVCSSKAKVDRPLAIQTLLGETKVCSRVRVSEPGTFLARVPGVRVQEFVGTAALKENQAEDKVFIWQRVWPQSPRQQQELIQRGYLVIAEIDDDPLRWREAHEANDFFAFRSCHGIQTSTEPLAAYLSQFNPNVAVFPNQLAHLPPPRLSQASARVTLFFGALNREEDWKPIMPVLNELLDQYKEKVAVQVVHDRTFFDALHTADKTFTPFCSYKEYIARLRTSDIAILPLEPTRFNSMKSDLKYLECAGHGVVALASPTVYQHSIRHGETGLIFRSLSEFREMLSRLISDSGLRAELSVNAYQWVAENRLLSQHYKERLHWYRDMLGKLSQLNDEVRVRTPELDM